MSFQGQAMDAVGVLRVEFCCSRNIGCDNVYILAAQTAEIIVKGDCAPAFGGQ